MKRAIAVLRAGTASDLRPVDTLLLDYKQRQRPEGAHTALRGTQITMALTQTVRLRTDDRLILDDDTLVEIVAQPEQLYELRTASLYELARIAWMLGDRHLAVDISERRLRLRRDPAVDTLLANAAVKIAAIDAPFEPEGGAYAHAAPEGSTLDHGCPDSEHNHHDH
jgi:urease accessory protein